MEILSVNVALPKSVTINGQSVLTGIDKQPVRGRIAARTLGLDGDGQADHSVHGGSHQAIYGYAFEHYAFWQNYLHSVPLAHGTFGENLTTTGLLETEVCIGDTFRCGTALLQVTAPRLPCFKFAHQVGCPTILKDFLRSGFCGFYFRVLEEGDLAAGVASGRHRTLWHHAEPHAAEVRRTSRLSSAGVSPAKQDGNKVCG